MIQTVENKQNTKHARLSELRKLFRNISKFYD